MGHYRLMMGYDDAAAQWNVWDSYVSTGLDKSQPYDGIRIAYDQFDAWWKVFDRTYIVLYKDAQAPLVQGILGAEMDDKVMWARSLANSQAATQANARDAIAWFTTGKALTVMERYPEAAAAFDQARQIGLPWRMMWYQFEPLQAYYLIGRYQEIVSLADAINKNGAGIEELFYWKGMALQAQGDFAGARAAFDEALKLHPGYQDAAAALAKLSP